MIYQDLFEDDYFGTKDYGMRLLWIGLIAAAADDQGRILDNTALIRAKIFMYDNTSNDDVDRWLTILNADNKIVRYKAGGKNLIQIIKWWEYQTPAWASPSKYKPPTNWVDRSRYHVSGNKQGGKVETINWNKEGGFHGEQPMTLHSEQPNELHSEQDSTFGSGIDDIKLSRDDVNDDVKLSESTNDKSNLFDSCKAIYENKKGMLITDPQSFVLMINNFKDNNVTAEDYAAAIDAMDADGRYRGGKPTSYEKWAIGYADKRKHPTKKKTDNQLYDREKLLKEVFND